MIIIQMGIIIQVDCSFIITQIMNIRKLINIKNQIVVFITNIIMIITAVINSY